MSYSICFTLKHVVMVRVFYEKSLCMKTVVLPKHIFHIKIQNIFIFELKIVTVSGKQRRSGGARRGRLAQSGEHVRSSTNGPCAAFEPSLHSVQNNRPPLVASLLSAQNYNV